MDTPNDILPVLARYHSLEQPGRIESLQGNGGLSGARFWRVEASARLLMVRRWPTEHPSDPRLLYIHEVLRHVRERGFTKVPLPLRARSGETFVRHAGYRWQVEPWLPGRNDYKALPSTKRLREAMATLAQFHLAASDFPTNDAPSGTSQGLHDRAARLERLAKGGLDQLRRQIDAATFPEFAPLATSCCEMAASELSRFASEVSASVDFVVPSQPVICDVWHDNMLFEGDRVTGLVDFSAMQHDSVARDVARLLGGMASDDRSLWDEGLAAYQAVRPLAAHEQQLVGVFDRCNVVLSGLNWIAWIYDERRMFESSAAVMDRMRHFVDRLTHWVHRDSAPDSI